VHTCLCTDSGFDSEDLSSGKELKPTRFLTFQPKKTAAPIWSKSSDTSLLADGEIILSPLQFGWMGPFDSDTHIFIGDQGTNRWHLSISILSDTTKILLSPGEDFFPIYIIYVKLQ
jgi:hypothetical protein